ncbi:hypothetical protein L195_g023049 [Trifolium pratense]|uniref:Sugar phosphate transporter domain-containing protein n=2 Tax=Trifolium pratense TaxID=57577 RepID=A0A2K3N9V6_TRIPR|nr:hypothetical protein L195_g023049 [Trifolium pratense]
MTQMMKNSIPWPTIMVVISWYSSNIGVLLMNNYVGIYVMDIVPLQSVQSKNQLFKICGLSVVFCFSVVCGNISLNYIPVSFNQAIGATTPFFTAIFAYFVSRKREAWVTYGTLLPVVTGVIIASGRKIGFYEPAALYGTYSNDGVTSCNIVDGGKRASDDNRACQRGFQNYLVLGNAKGAVAVVISILIFQNPISMIGMLGYVLTIIGVILYSETKKRYST